MYKCAVPVLPALAWLEQLDQTLLHWINCDLHSQGLQDVLFFIQSRDVGVPLVVVLIVGILFVRGRRTALRVLLTCVFAFLVGWGLAEGMWRAFERPRPPHVIDTVLRTPEERATCAAHPESVSVRKYISRRPGFPSQHALHSAAFATALFLAVRWVGLFAAVYALLVAVARVMIGTHWPSDVITGLILGPLIAWGVWRLLPRVFGLVGLRSWLAAPDVQAVSEGSSEPDGERG